jgi:adenylate cyclase
MSIVNQDKLKKIVMERFSKAEESVALIKKAVFSESVQVVSNNIAPYDIHKMEFGAYKEDNYVSFFADMRGSSKRPEKIGSIKTFLTIHAVMPAMIYVVESYNGNIVDIPGDGIMALFKENTNGMFWNDDKKKLNPESLAVECGKELLEAITNIVNPLLESKDILPVVFGIGVDVGNVVVTKIGTDKTIDIKAIGSSINNAAKKSKGNSEIYISNEVYKKIPSIIQNGYRPSSETGWYIKKV